MQTKTDVKILIKIKTPKEHVSLKPIFFSKNQEIEKLRDKYIRE